MFITTEFINQKSIITYFYNKEYIKLRMMKCHILQKVYEIV